MCDAGARSRNMGDGEVSIYYGSLYNVGPRILQGPIWATTEVRWHWSENIHVYAGYNLLCMICVANFYFPQYLRTIE